MYIDTISGVLTAIIIINIVFIINYSNVKVINVGFSEIIVRDVSYNEKD